jgi:acyl-coenzyme A synthetase/AMP-(fatty) acid ligase
MVQDYKITYGYVVPPILLGLSKAPIVDNYDLTSLETFMSAAAPLTKEIVNAVWHRLKIPVKQAYGLSETSPATHIQVRYLINFERKVTNPLPSANRRMANSSWICRKTSPQPNRQIRL